MSEILSPSEETIEFGGLVWKKTDNPHSCEYRSNSPGTGDYRISQYEDGRWHCMSHIDEWLDPLIELDVITDLFISKIKPTRDEAMQFCIDAKDLLTSDVKKLSFALSIGDYATGFKEGQSALAKDIREVLP
ncbi:MAG: hypothetical protein LLG15_01780 [Betaproteobacteria bacterium]|nr:hypothetical protein [Betaproteobacteria bacterium]